MDNSTDKNFFKHVFNFDDDSKSDIFNIIQYALLAIIPVVILNKAIGKYIPEANDNKGSLEIVVEIVIQIIVTFIGLLLVHRIITFIPTYSEAEYPNFFMIYIILAVLMITMSLQTKLGEKISIITERVYELWHGPSATPNKNSKGKTAIRVSQPIAGQPAGTLQMQTANAAITQSLYTDGTAISSLPTNEMTQPNYNAMYRQDNTPLINASTPGATQESFGPVPASEVLGGSFGSTW